jgi:2-iminobutanoate/2-iminopropanoate deaminase
MPRHIVTTPNAPTSPVWSQAVKAGHLVFVSGIVGIDPRTGALAGETIQEQTRQALTNCEEILDAAGATMDDIVEVCTLLTDPADFDGMNEEYAKWFPVDPPARFTPKLGVDIPGVLISIRVVAFTA